MIEGLKNYLQHENFIRIKFFTVALISVFSGAVLFWGVDHFVLHAKEPVQSCAESYPFLNSTLDCKDIEQKFQDIENIGTTVEEIFAEEKANHTILEGSFYYRDLKTRRFVGVNDDQSYHPASLTKLPIAMLYYKLEEIKNGSLDTEMSLTEEHLKEDELQYYQPSKKLKVDVYTVRELIEYMLKYSQNAAVRVLYSGPSQITDTVLSDLGIYIPSDKGYGQGIWHVTTRTYSNVLRALYNASYLSLEHSNEVLEILSQSEFEGGIAKVPAGVRVAHKFGEATKSNPEGEVLSRVLNHCGIVYKPEEPYIICIMTEGEDFEKQKKVIERIGEMVYEQQ